MATSAKVGANMTGVQMSPKDTKSLLEAVEQILPDVPGDSKAIKAERIVRNEEADRIGSVPVPGSAKGMLKTTFDKVLGNNPELLVDKLGERLAYERTGVRLYEALIAKALACEGHGAELVPTLQQIRNDEQAHMFLLINAIETLGADPTAMTPGADVVGVLGSGPLKVITDPRTNMAQALDAILTIELADNAAWEMLIKLAEQSGHAKIARTFDNALVEEERHVNTIRSLLSREMGLSAN